MGVFGAIATAIATVFTTVAIAVYSIIAALVSFVASIVVVAYTAVSALVTIAYASIAALLTGSWATLATTFSAQVASISSVIVTAYTTVSYYVVGVAFAFKAFAEAIHLHTLIQLNNVATIVSPEYRNAVARIFGKLNQMSAAIGMGEWTMTTLIRGARNIVLDTSAAIGQPYDIAEVGWMNQLLGFLKRMQNQPRLYQLDPTRLLTDLDRTLVKDAIDTKAYAAQNTFLTIEKIIDGTKEFATNVDKVRKDVDDFTAALPESIRTKVEAYTKPITDKLNETINVKYKGVTDTLFTYTHAFNLKLTEQKNRLSDITQDILHPGTLLKKIDKLPPTERQQQEAIIGEVATRSLSTRTDEITVDTEAAQEHMQEIIDLVNVYTSENTWEVPEKVEPKTKPQEEQGQENTWFVGDY